VRACLQMATRAAVVLLMGMLTLVAANRPVGRAAWEMIRASTGELKPGFLADGVTPSLNFDQAGVRFLNNLTTGGVTDLVVAVHYQNDLCHGCVDIPVQDPSTVGLLPLYAWRGSVTAYATFDTAFATTFFFYNSDASGPTNHSHAPTPFVTLHHALGEYGLYTVVLNGGSAAGGVQVNVVVDAAPSSTTYQPIMVCSSGCVCVCVRP
jgi:hypothetical protein